MRITPYRSDPKPLPAGTHRLVRICSCGRRIRADEIPTLFSSAAPCPDCGGRTWIYWKRRVTIVERLEAWLALWRWKRRRRGMRNEMNKLVSIIWQAVFGFGVLAEGGSMGWELFNGLWSAALASAAIAGGCLLCLHLERKYRIR